MIVDAPVINESVIARTPSREGEAIECLTIVAALLPTRPAERNKRYGRALNPPGQITLEPANHASKAQRLGGTRAHTFLGPAPDIDDYQRGSANRNRRCHDNKRDAPGKCTRRHVVPPPRHYPNIATCPGALIVHADNTVMTCTEDEEPNGCRGRDLRHEGDPVRCWTRTMSGCNYCGVQ
jgi:hypothetical protein